MENLTDLANRCREVLLNGKWIANTNFKEQISSINWQQATYKVGSLNTIAALTFHINYYLGGIINVFETGTLDIKDKYSFDMLTINNEEDWNKLKSSFIDNAEKFAAHIQQLPNEQLDQIFVDEKYGSYRRNIEGIIEHSYYHLGQISLLKKIILVK